ncbi:MAG: lipid A export permease/ATP-binding protein MsbA [Alphaproteobacteria bacterium]|nr:lipid A export permease/ATP-binding protein MsbA [Alphaproteobacteria bacterium]MBF0129897.1 lipid A export permease/ATP-binding protein MsbA [Alphaproteobacteria bacterium]
MSKAILPLDLSTLALTRRLLREAVRPYVWRILLAVVLMGLVAAATAFSTFLLNPIVDRVFVEKNESLLPLIGGAVLVTFIVKGAADFGQAALMSFVGLRIVANMQIRLFNHLVGMDVPFFQTTTTGRLISRFTTDIGMLRAAVSDVLTSLGKESLTIIGLVANMFWQDWMLASVTFFIFPLAVLPILRLGRRMRKVTVNTQEHIGSMTTLLEQTFQGIRVVKAYGMEDYERGRMGGIIETIFGLTLKSQLTRAFSSPIMETLGGVAITVVVVYGGWRVIHTDMTPGAFFSFIASLLTAYRPLKSLANVNNTLQEGLASAQRLFAVFDTLPQIEDRPGAVDLPDDGGSIRFDHVSFSYDDSRRALDGLSLDVPSGATVALVGASGAGKTTILNLIPRFYEATEGAVKVNGRDVRDLTLRSLRSRIALVSQDVVLFDDTVRANIAYGRLDATPEEIEAAARHAAAHDFIAALPQGYDTVVGERGLSLSGGQRQRLAIARAMLRDAPILLLDEATSALDSESERQVQAALTHLMQGRTTLVIAHRLSTVVGADVIHVVDRGRIVESGTHEELLALGRAYAHLYALQFASVDEGAPVPA